MLKQLSNNIIYCPFCRNSCLNLPEFIYNYQCNACQFFFAANEEDCYKSFNFIIILDSYRITINFNTFGEGRLNITHQDESKSLITLSDFSFLNFSCKQTFKKQIETLLAFN